MPKIGMEPIRRAQVIRAVIESIAEQGLEALTMDAVAKKADVSKGVVNYYFAGKRDLLLQSFHAFLESYNQKIADSIQPDMSAMEMMAVNPVPRVLVPRFLGGVISMPLLAGIFSAVGMFGALNVQPKGARMYRSQMTEEELRLATTGYVQSDCEAGQIVGRECNAGGQPIIDY